MYPAKNKASRKKVAAIKAAKLRGKGDAAHDKQLPPWLQKAHAKKNKKRAAIAKKRR